MHRGNLLASLRTARGLSQIQLAELAGVSRTRLATVEADPSTVLRRSTLELISAGLEKVRPFTPSERDAFLEAFQLGSVWKIATQTLKAIEQTPHPGGSINALAAAAEHEQDALTRRIERLRVRYGSLVLGRVLDAMEILLPVAALAADEPTAVRVVNPPVQREGYTEQVITEYERVEPASKPAQRRKRG